MIASPDPAAGEMFFALPDVLPDGRTMTYTVATGANASDLRIDARPLSGGTRRIVVDDASHGRYLPTGHLVFARGGALFAAPFDPVTASTTGGAVSVLDDVMHTPSARNDFLRTGAAQMAIARSGDLAYLTGGSTPDAIGRPVWIDNGDMRPIGDARADYLRPRVSPDGTRISAVTRGREQALWVFSVADGTGLKVPFDGAITTAEWISDTMLVVTGVTRGVANLYRMRADGSTTAERLTTGTAGQMAISVSPDGREALYLENRDIWALTLDSRQARPIVESPLQERAPQISPDGRWLVYETPDGLIVRPYPSLDGRFAVGPPRSRHPRWSRDGRSLFFATIANNQNIVMKADVRATPTSFAIANANPVWTSDATAIVGGSYQAFYDVDARNRFLAIALEPPTPTPARAIHLVVNWFEELRARTAGR